MFYDVRAIRFIKSSSKAPIRYNKKARYICLGHFDLMDIDCIASYSNEPLSRIQSDRTSGNESKFKYTENHIYSLYILKTADKSQSKELDDFFKSTSTYTVVTRIHCDYPNTKEIKPFTQIITEHCLDNKNKSVRVFCNNEKENSAGVLHLSGAVAGEKTVQDSIQYESVDCVLYNSLELGDTVAIMKSQSLAAILEVVRYIMSLLCPRHLHILRHMRRITP